MFIPGDMEPDLLWEDEEPTEEQRVAIDDGCGAGNLPIGSGVARRRPARCGLIVREAGAFVVASKAAAIIAGTVTNHPAQPAPTNPTPKNQPRRTEPKIKPNPPTQPNRTHNSNPSPTHEIRRDTLLGSAGRNRSGLHAGVIPGVIDELLAASRVPGQLADEPIGRRAWLATGRLRQNV